ncbi:sigma-70 family RNA polymerase sigma factor [Streptomyces rhizosphaerihabitans]|uniref:sigma-70 family RNA polymerase sigma factor n=1 Tax=Streptomyces rhizosphaerihabitans TaxID=1266770 RepID=UPI0021C1454D|nr:sigma-70 family RNA polymerase sigma factor [Streptomyces rhizosphaerihabitans]MCT9008285.1 sigma-70 family RNA polymerase sigma factor [Streptomyces rhizosphaerihabitans]
MFVAHARALGLGGVELERLREELGRLGLPVRGAAVHAGGDSPDVEKVARSSEENVCDSASPSDGAVSALLNRYADPEGYVTARVVDGVARLAGLGPRDAAALRAGARIRGEVAAPAEALAEAGNVMAETGVAAPGADALAMDLTDLADAEGYESAGLADDDPFPLPEAAIGGDVGDLTAAVAAAMAVLESDRVRRRPDMHLLTAEAEVGLAVLVRGGPDHVAEEADDETLRGLPADDLRIRARDCFVLHNQRLVHKMVPRYLDQGLDYDDLFQHGALGLMRAARKFDPAKGFKFSTYATWWVRQSIARGIADDGATIRIPVHMHEQVRKVALAERTLSMQGRPAGVADVAVFCDMTMKKVEEARKLSRRTDSLDRVVGDGVTLGDFIGRTNPLPPVDRGVLDAWLLEQALAIVDTFTEREARILVRRLGLDRDEPSTLDELGREFGVTRERIRQIETKTLVAFRERLRTAGLTDAYRYEDGRESGPEVAADASSPGEGVGPHAKAGARRQSAKKQQVRDVLPAPAPQEVLQEGHLQSTEAPEAPDGEHLGQDKMAEPGEHTVDAEESKESAADRRSVVVTVPAPGPGEAVDLRHEGRPDDSGPPVAHAPGTAVTGPDATSGMEQAQKPCAEPVEEPAPERSYSAPAVTEASGASTPEPVEAPAQYTADWQRALRMQIGLGEGVAWLAEYALLALGHAQLAVLLGSSSAENVVRAVRDRTALDRPEITALEVLRRVFDTVKGLGLRPEDFFERPAEALVGVSPRAYLAAKPLVLSESRLAVRDSLREFVAEVPHAAQRVTRVGGSPDRPAMESFSNTLSEPLDTAQVHAVNPPDHDAAAAPDDTQVEAPGIPRKPTPVEDTCLTLDARTPEEVSPAGTAHRGSGWDKAKADDDSEQRLNDVRREHEAELTRVRDEARRDLAEARQSAEARRTAALADTEQQLDALEETLLRRADKTLLRRERYLQAHSEERIARLQDEHREERQTLADRAEHALQKERAARTALAAALERAARAEQRAKNAEQLAASFEPRANDAEQRASTAGERAASLALRADEAQRRAEETGQRLRRYREEGEARIAGLEHRLSQAETLLAERDAALHAARWQATGQVQAAEQRAAERIAQAEHDAWARITELQQQLAAERDAAANRSTLRDRWRRS